MILYCAFSRLLYWKMHTLSISRKKCITFCAIKEHWYCIVRLSQAVQQAECRFLGPPPEWAQISWQLWRVSLTQSQSTLMLSLTQPSVTLFLLLCFSPILLFFLSCAFLKLFSHTSPPHPPILKIIIIILSSCCPKPMYCHFIYAEIVTQKDSHNSFPTVPKNVHKRGYLYLRAIKQKNILSG